MADSDPGLMQLIVDRLRAIGAPPQSDADHRKQEQAAGRKLPMGNMSEVDRMAAGLPPVQRYKE